MKEHYIHQAADSDCFGMSSTSNSAAQLQFQAQLLENVRESVYATDLEGRICYWGKGAERLYGYTAEEVLGRPLAMSVGPFEGTEELPHTARLMDTGRWSGEYVQQRKDGSLFLSDMMISLICDEQNQPCGFIMIERDITERKQNDEILRYSEERYRVLVESVPDTIFTLNENGDFLSVNQKAAETLGKLPKELVGLNLTQILPPEEAAVQLEIVKKVFHSGETCKIPDSSVQTDNGGKWFSTVLTPIANSQGHIMYVVGIARDITERKLAEDTLRFQAQLLDSVRESVVATDLDGRIIYWGKGAEFLYGYTAHEAIGAPLTKLIEYLDEEADRARRAQVLKQGFWSGQYIQQRRDDSLFWTDTTISLVRDKDGKPCGLIGIERDITDYKQAENAIRASEVQYRLLAEKVADGIGILQHKRLVFVNEKLSQILKYPSEMLLKMDPTDLFTDEYRDVFRLQLDQMEHVISDDHCQAQCLTGDGRPIWVEWHQSTIAWKQHSAILVTVRDITTMKHRELALSEEHEILKRENLTLRSSIGERYKFGLLVGKSAPMQEVYQFILNAAASDANVVIYGESGTGKELVAQTIHQMSDRKDAECVTINCGAIPESLFESHFFGHVKGAFTGATANKEGFFDRAHNGTLFLDEVGELSPGMQVKLLRALQDGEYTPVGSNMSKQADVRIIAATNRELREQVRKKLVREDFFYRIHVVAINLPPLRSRQEDIPLLIEHFLQKMSNGGRRLTIPAKIMDAFLNYEWPGNVRQLQNELQRYLATQELNFTYAPEMKSEAMQKISEEIEPSQNGLGLRKAMEEFEKQLITTALNSQQWHRARTAHKLDIPLRTLHRKMKKYELI